MVTGAASGIGRRAAVQIAAAGDHAVVIARTHDRARDLVAEASAAARDGGKVTVVPADLADLAQVRRAAERIVELGPIDALINNAATFDLARKTPRLTVDGIEQTFAVNHVAPFVLTAGVRPALRDDAMVVTAGSKRLLWLPLLRMDRDDIDSRNHYSPIRGYFRSKIAQLAFTAELARRGVAASALRIPSVRVDDDKLIGYRAHQRAPYRLKAPFAADPAVIAAGYLTLAASAPTMRARYVDERGRDVRWTHGTGVPAFGAWVWDQTAALAGRTPPTER